MTPTPDTDELMACPFCGSDSIGFKDAGLPDCYAGCNGCGATTLWKESRAEAITAWNRRIASTRPADSALACDCRSGEAPCAHCSLVEEFGGRIADGDNITISKALYDRVRAALRQPAPRADDAQPIEARLVETVQTWPPGEPGEPFWRIEIDGYCADFDHEGAAKNFASRINYLIRRAALQEQQR